MLIQRLLSKKYNNEYICFNALHGPFGEDGSIQKILDNKNFKYTHSKTKSSNICFNKKLTKDIVKNLNLLTPDYITLEVEKINKNKLRDIFLSFGPFVLKPISSGSSFGIKIFKNENEINYFFENIRDQLEIYKNHKELLVEKFIFGKELTVSVIEKNNESLPIEVTEILPNNNFFDYESKYTPGLSKHLLPAEIPTDIYNSCKEIAKNIHDKIELNGVSRSDFVLNNRDLFFLEINSQPGLTSISLVPEQLKYQNISFDELITNIILCAK